MTFTIAAKERCLNAFARTAVILIALMAGSMSAHASSDEVKTFYIKTVHVDGVTSIHGDDTHAPEAFPNEKMPEGGGLVLTGPGEDGKWKMRAFAFMPSQMTVHAGDRVRLNFVGAQGTRHTIHVEGDGIDQQFQLLRGTIKRVEFTAEKAGVVEVECYDHEPSMTAQVLILPKP